MKWFLYLVVFGLVGCATTALYEGGSTLRYEEKVSSYFVSGQDEIIIVGEKYHYILEEDTALASLARSKMGQRLNLDVQMNFNISTDGKMWASLELLSAREGGLDTLLLESVGFSQITTPRNRGRYKRKFSLKGKRYLAGAFKLPQQYEMQKERKINVEVEENGVSVKQVLLTPLAVTIDGVIILAAVPVVVTAGILSLLFKSSKKTGNSWQ
jgi:hypothetical protein